MITVPALALLGVILFIAGVFAAVFYIVLRMMRNDGWDDSNMTNGLRLLSHVALHSEDFGAMYYLSPEMLKLLKNNGHDPERPFWYVSEDEFEGVVKSRPDFDINDYKDEEEA